MDANTSHVHLWENPNIYAFNLHSKQLSQAWDIIEGSHCWWWWLEGPLEMASREWSSCLSAWRWEGGHHVFLWYLRLSHTAIDFWGHRKCAGTEVEILYSPALTGTLHNCKELRLGSTVSLCLRRSELAWKGTEQKQRGGLRGIADRVTGGELRWNGFDTDQHTPF